MTRLTIAVDARLLFDSPRRGIGKTSIALYRALAQVRPNWSFRLYYRAGRFANPFPDQFNLIPEQLELPGYRLYGPFEKWVNPWEAVRLPWELLRRSHDLVHLPGGLYPRFTPGPLVATIHDLIPIDTRPNDPDVLAWTKAVRRSAENARAILTASEHARERIVETFRIPREKIHLVKWGPVSVPAEPLSAQAERALRAKYQLPEQGPYLLHYGLEDPRKNTLRLLEAWAGVPPQFRAQHPLLVVGFQGPGLQGAATRCAELGISADVRLFGYIPEEDGQQLLAGAAILCYPSLYEGYGLPIVEAFRAGVPVLASCHTSIPEVAGDAAYLVDATKTAELTRALTELLRQPQLRQDLVQRGKQRVEPVTWERCAEDVATVFERVTTAPRRGV